ncbi:MAG: hypothetical protein K1Y36_22985 [Blastocatellia bacterium]|nr:hypothetical protein [Blastocatellia bacterium]
MDQPVISKTIGQVTELTCIAPIIPGKADALREAFTQISLSPENPLKKISTIHFARWVIFDNDTRLLFTSNFDGGWEDYLRDFATLDAEGLDFIFQYCVGYPGAQPFEPFMEYVRTHQVETTFFYPAYPNASVKQIFLALDWKAKTDNYMRELQKPPSPNVGQ